MNSKIKAGRNELTLQEKKDIEKGILDYVASVCGRHGITYFLAYGTLLGAVRHQGFIPWDDDIDIVLLRPEYERLLEAIAADDDLRYRLMRPGMEGYYYPFAKVVDSRTEVEEKNVDPIDGMGLWVDVFPLDGVKNPDSLKMKYLRFLDRCRAASVNSRFPVRKYSRMFYLPWLFCRLAGWKFFLSREMKLSRKLRADESGFLNFAIEDRCSLPGRLFAGTATVMFEGTAYLCPQGWAEYLEINYGDYMKLPPVEDRVVHGMRAVMAGETTREV